VIGFGFDHNGIGVLLDVDLLNVAPGGYQRAWNKHPLWGDLYGKCSGHNAAPHPEADSSVLQQISSMDTHIVAHFLPKGKASCPRGRQVPAYWCVPSNIMSRGLGSIE